MISYRLHSGIDKSAWDRALLNCANKLWYARSHVLDIASPGWDALVDEESGAMMPLTWRRKFGVPYLFQPFGLQQLGVFAPTGITPKTSTDFMNALQNRFKLIEIATNQGMPMPAIEHLNVTEHPDHLIDLSGGMEQVRARYAKGHERNLKRSANGTSISIKPMLPSEFCALFTATTAERFKGIDGHGLRSLPALLQAGVDRGEVDIIGTKGDGDRWVAGAAFVHWQGRSILLKSAATDEGREQNAMFHMLDAGLERACGRSAIMDLAGSEHPGTARFYEGFGARPTVYLRLSMNDLPFWLKPFKR